MITIENSAALRRIMCRCEEEIKKEIGQEVTLSYRLKYDLLSTEELKNLICDVCEVYWDDILSSKRSRIQVAARQLFCHYAVKIQNKTVTEIGKILNRDHTTVIYSRDTIKDRIHTGDGSIMPFYLECEKRLAKFGL